MIGTVAGFLLMLGSAFQDLDVKDVSNVQEAIADMAVGMSTALSTTLMGLICSVLTKLQMVLFENSNDNEEHPEIRALSVYPGVVNTDMQLKIRSTNIEEFPLKNKFVEYFKNDELTEPKDVAQKIFYIMSNLSKFSKNMVSVRDF